MDQRLDYRVAPSSIRDARIAVPGDKSISHRALMLASLANGRSTISGFLAGEDCLATLAACREMRVAVSRHSATELSIDGVGLSGLSRPSGPLDLGNSGTAMRLMAGMLAGQSFSSTLTGDTSLSSRPMNRIIAPLEQMGAKIESDDGTPPLAITGGRALRCINYEMPIASAQVKSAVLIAGLYASGITHVTEPAVTRDHTERMLRTLGAEVDSTATRISVQGRPTLIAQDMQIPGDLSSATFLMLAAILAEGAEVVIESVGVNPTRTGVVDILQAMGADITLQNHRQFGEEPVADIHVRSSSLKGIAVEPSLVSLAIDEFPALFVAAGAASGKTTFSGIAELRVKESDRIAAMATGLRSLGIDVDELHDGAIVHGGRYHGGSVESFGDHRIAMSLAVAGTVAADAVLVKDVVSVNTSFPGFVDSLSNLGAEIVESTQERP